jgi:thiamine biosynthesis protein ThiS
MKVNGIYKQLEESITLEQFLMKEEFSIPKVAVELNGDIVPKLTYNQIVLTESDILEIVHFVGGG